MKSFFVWLAGFVVIFGVFAVVTNVTRSTQRVFVVVDSSFPMNDVWTRVPGQLDALDDERYSEFALATEKDLVHGWQSSLSLVGVTPFAPCDFAKVESYPEIAEADRLILVTTAASCDTAALVGSWRVIELEP